jgi:hypothetical protein
LVDFTSFMLWWYVQLLSLENCLKHVLFFKFLPPLYVEDIFKLTFAIFPNKIIIFFRFTYTYKVIVLARAWNHSVQGKRFHFTRMSLVFWCLFKIFLFDETNWIEGQTEKWEDHHWPISKFSGISALKKLVLTGQQHYKTLSQIQTMWHEIY